jgi:DNA-3-methyladenine glycosylase
MTRRGRPLPRSFFDRDARAVAPELLNKLLHVADPVHGDLRVRLVEVEAYCGAEDPGAHSYRGRTRRNATMFGPPGRLYVYFTYGMHWCANAVCGPGARPHAVLLRAGVPLEGLAVMQARRPAARSDRELCSGPANLTRALGIDGRFDGAGLTRGPVRLLDDGVEPPARPAVGRRIGLAAGKGDEFDWRFAVAGDPHVSRPRPRSLDGTA